MASAGAPGHPAGDLPAGTAFVSFIGVDGGAGTSSMALGLAGEMSAYRGKKTVYLSFEPVEAHGLGVSARMAGAGDASGYLFGFVRSLSPGKDGPPAVAPYLARDDFGTRRFRPSAGLNSLHELTGDILVRFIETVCSGVGPDVVVLDWGTMTTGDARVWARASHRTVLVGSHGVTGSPGDGVREAFDLIASGLGLDEDRVIYALGRAPADADGAEAGDGIVRISEDPYAFDRDGSEVAVSLATAFGTGVKLLVGRAFADDAELPDMPGAGASLTDPAIGAEVEYDRCAA
jgi:hypothetical protein